MQGQALHFSRNLSLLSTATPFTNNSADCNSTDSTQLGTFDHHAQPQCDELFKHCKYCTWTNTHSFTIPASLCAISSVAHMSWQPLSWGSCVEMKNQVVAKRWLRSGVGAMRRTLRSDSSSDTGS